MKSLTILTALFICVVWLGANPPKGTARLDEIKKHHKQNCDAIKTGIYAGYMAAHNGWPLSNYLADVEKIWAKQLEERIAEETKK